MSIKSRRFEEKVILFLSGASAIFVALILVLILGTVTIKGLPSVNLHYLTTSEQDSNGFGTAVGNALVGTIYLSTLSVALATPFALCTAIYLKRYAKDTVITRTIRLLIEMFSGTPSIVVGLVGLIILSYYLKSITGGWSLISGAVAVAILILPVIERSIEEAIGTVPIDLEHASYALGADKWNTVRRVTIPYAISGILTGVILGVGRSAEESAVVLLTAGYTQFFPSFGIGHNPKLLFGIDISPLQDTIGTLPIAIYNSFQYPTLVGPSSGFADAFILIVVVLLINLVARIVLWRFKRSTNPTPDSGNPFSFGGFFRKKGPGNSGSSLIPHVGIFNRSKSVPNEKQMDGMFSDLQKKPEKSDVENSIRPYLVDPLKETPSSPGPSPALSKPVPAIDVLPKGALLSSEDAGLEDKMKMPYFGDSRRETSSSGAVATIVDSSMPTIELLPNETLQSSPDQSAKPTINKDKTPYSILAPPSEKPQLPEEKTPFSVFVVDPAKLTDDEVLSEDTASSHIPAQNQPPLLISSSETALPVAPLQLTELSGKPLPDSTPILIPEAELNEPETPTIEIIEKTVPSHELNAHKGGLNLQLIGKEDTQMKQLTQQEKLATDIMSKTKDGKPFLDLLHPPGASNMKKEMAGPSSLISQVSNVAMPYTINGPDKDPGMILHAGYVEIMPPEEATPDDQNPPVHQEKTPYNIVDGHAIIKTDVRMTAAKHPTPERINDITHTVKEQKKPETNKTINFDLQKIFGGFKKNGNGRNGAKGNGAKGEETRQAVPTEDEVKSTMQKPTKKNGLFSGLNLGLSKPKVAVELLDFNVGHLSVPSLDCSLKETDVTYEIDPPFQYVHVYFDGEEMSYNVLEPKLSDGEKKYLVIIERALEKLISSKIVAIRPEEREDFLHMRFSDIVKMYGFNLNEDHQDRMFYYIRKNYLGLNKIDIIMKDHYIEDISCNGPNNYLYVYHRVYGSVRTNVSFEEVELNKFVMRMAQMSGKHISILQPIKDVSMPDGSRANLTLGSEVTKKGATFTIRKFRDRPMSPVELMEYNSIDPLCLAYLWILLDYKKSILVSGGTASGKTTLLNVICSFIRPENKIVSLEDTAELNLVHPNWIQSVTRSGFGAEAGSNSVSGVSGVSAKSPGDIGLYDLLVAALRQRPEYIICGEVRGAEAFTMFQAIAVGHACMGTIHAGTMRELLSRIESNPMNVPRTLFSALDVVCFNSMVRHKDRNVRRVMTIVEILELDANGDLVTNPVFRWDAKTDRFIFTGKSHIFEKIDAQLGVREQDLVREMQERANFLKSLQENNIREYAAVVEKIHEYTLNHG